MPLVNMIRDLGILFCIFAICFLYLIWLCQSLSRFFLFKTACLSNNRLANAWFSRSILSVSLFRTSMFRLIGPDLGPALTLWFLLATLRGAVTTLDHFPDEISTSLFSKIWLSLLIVRFFSLVRNSFVFRRSCLFFLI